MSVPTPVNSRGGTKLFQQDIVQRISSPTHYGVVLRCWHDNEDVPPPTPATDPMMRPLLYGEVGVTFISHGREREILFESELRLVDRTLQPGDYCKRSFDDVRAGVVTSLKVKGRIAHAINRQEVDGWYTTDDLLEKSDGEIGDYVTFDDWLGQIIEVFDESVIQIPSGHLVGLPEIGSRFTVGESGTNILPLAGMSDPSGPRRELVIAVRHNTYAVAWLALNQSLNFDVSAKKSRPKRFWSGEDIAKLTLLRGRSELEMRVGDRVLLKRSTGMPFTEHGRGFGPTSAVIQVNTCVVTETSTEVDVLWQDGTMETLKSIDVMPYLNPDEYDCWPGDHVLWKKEDQTHPAIVQFVNAAERVSLVLLPDIGSIELAPLLELDAHGNSDHGVNNPHAEAFGVRRGDFVFIHAPGTTNGLNKPRVPRIGEVEPWVREDPFSNDDFSGWRKELYEHGTEIAAKRASGTHVEYPIQLPVKYDGKFHWCGEVTGLNLDGSVSVTHPDCTVIAYPLERLTKLYDGLEQLEDEGWDEGSDEDHYSDDNEGRWEWGMDEDEEMQPNPDALQELNLWEAALTPANVAHSSDVQMSDDEVDAIQVDEDLWSSDNDMTGEDEITHSNIKQGVDMEAHSYASAEVETIDFSDGIKWNRFEILSSAPSDHFFYSSPPTQVSRSFLSRLNKEYRVLRSSLPDSILVRAYEDRTDLIRSLIIGPQNTPYQDAPFVIDWLLDSNFPQGPPIAHFHSWTSGNGRVNPNLYEEGKVCLSILGTWSGDKDEIWSSARSSLLQAFVSIQGLVLVKEPWFCEPAYDKLRGTAEGTVNSRLYSEKAYVLSRGFVRRALEMPPGGLEAEITQLYRNERRLDKVIGDAEQLIQKSRDNQEILPQDHDLAVPRLSAGGIISLERTLAKLRTFIKDM